MPISFIRKLIYFKEESCFSKIENINYSGLKDSKRNKGVVNKIMLKNNYFGGIDLGGTNIKAVVINKKGKIFYQKNVPTQKEKEPEVVIKKIISLLNEMMNKKVLINTNLRALGIAVAGIVDMKEGVCKFLTNFPTKWRGISLAKKIKEGTGLQVFLINDVRAMTLGE